MRSGAGKKQVSKKTRPWGHTMLPGEDANKWIIHRYRQINLYKEIFHISITFPFGANISDAFKEHSCIFPPTVSDHSALCWANISEIQIFLLKHPFENIEVFKALCSIDPKKATKADDLQPSLLLLETPFLDECSTYTFNQTLVTECASYFWRTATSHFYLKF